MSKVMSKKNMVACLVLAVVMLGVCCMFGASNYSALANEQGSLKTDAAKDFSVKMIAERDGVNYFTIEFSEPISFGATKPGGGWKDDVQKDALIGDNILIGDYSVKHISENAEDAFGTPLANAIHVNVRKYPDQKNYGLEFWLDNKLKKDFKFDATSESGNKITIKKGLTFSYVGENGENVKLVKTQDEIFTYYKNTKMWQPQDFIPNSRQPKVKKISTIINDDNPDNFVQYLLVDFVDMPSKQQINHANYKAILNNVEINGKSISEIISTGKDKQGEKVLDAAYILFAPVEWFSGNDRIVMMIYLQRKLDDSFLMNKASTNTIVFKNGFTLPDGSVAAEDIAYDYSVDEDFWVAKSKITREYEEVKVSSISRFVEDLTAGKNHYFIIYFDKAVSAQFLPHVNASISWIQGINNLPSDKRPFYYSSAAMQALVRDKIRVSVLDYILFDDETIRQKMEKETGDKDISVIAHYQGQGSENGLIISFSGNGKNKVDLTVAHKLTLKKGFKTPKYNMLYEDVTFNYNPSDMLFREEKKEPTSPIADKGCNSIINNGGSSGALITQIIGLSLLLFALTALLARKVN